MKCFWSHDVTSLFTNIPLSDETIDFPVNAIFESSNSCETSTQNLQRNKVQLEKCFNFATSHIHFLFNGCFYDQIDGVAMGSPLDPWRNTRYRNPQLVA